LNVANLEKTQALKYDPSNELYVAIISGTIIFLLFSVFIIAYLVIYRRRNEKHKLEIERMQMLFNEEILKTQMEIQEQTLSNLSQEIHDNVGQILSLAKVQVSILHKKNVMDETLLLSVRENIGQAITDLRSMTHSMNTQRILNETLDEVIRQDIDRISSTGVLTASLTVDGNGPSLSGQKKLILFRIFQEAIQNVLKHAEAHSIEVSIHYLPLEVVLIMKDDGKGFDSNLLNGKSHGLGLSSMQNRATLIGGTASIDTGINKGTTIQIRIPH
jgi:signal transduction histidine kinase